MQEDFHYYATYAAAHIAGFSHDECMQICYSANFTDWCSRTFLAAAGAPVAAATTQLQLEMMETKIDTLGIQDITRIWSSFHFLPYNLYAEVKGSKQYRNKYRLICNVNSDLLADTVNLAKGKSLQAIGIAMHVLADTWAHRYFAGTPSRVINNTNYYFYELIPDAGGFNEKAIKFNHNPGGKDDPAKGIYTNTISSGSENTIMCLGHGRAGHLPDYSYVRYKYMPSWGGYEEIVKDNPSDYYHAFCQMVYALKFLKGNEAAFEKEVYDTKAVEPFESRIMEIFTKRQTDACVDWREFVTDLSGRQIEDFDTDKYKQEYMEAGNDMKDETFLGRFILAALDQKSMVTNKIYKSGNMLAGYSVDFSEKGFKGIKAYRSLVEHKKGGDGK